MPVNPSPDCPWRNAAKSLPVLLLAAMAIGATVLPLVFILVGFASGDCGGCS